jgi:hypothetical protein
VKVYWLGIFLETLYRAGSRQWVGCDKSDWWSGRAGCYSIGNKCAVEEKRWWEKFFKGHVVRRKVMIEVLVTIWIRKGDKRTSATTWVWEEVMKKFLHGQERRSSGYLWIEMVG